MTTSQKIIRLYWSHVKKYPGYVIGLLIALPLTVLTQQFLPPLIAAKVLDRLSTGDFEKNQLWDSFGTELTQYAILAFIGGVVAWRVIIYLIWKLEAYVLRDLMQTQFDHLLRLGAKFHANSFSGSLVSQTNKLAGSYIRMADTILLDIYTGFISVIVVIVIMWPKSPMFVILLFSFSIVFMYIATKVMRPVRDLVAKESRAQNRTTGVLADSLSNIMAVKSFSASKFERKRFSDATENVRLRTTDVMWASLKRDTLFGTITSTINGLSLVVAAASVVMFDAEIGTVFLMLAYTANITTRLWDFSQKTLKNYNHAIGHAKDGMAMLDLKLEVKDQENPEMSVIHDGQIDFKKVDFSYNEKDKLFNELSLSIKAGEKVGLVGHSGSGKTTLTQLLLRFTDIDNGSIEIDGQNIALISQDDLRTNIAYVPQEPLLFHRTIAENISYGDKNANEKDIVRAAKRANAHEFIRTLDEGYSTLVGERGVKLSGGQRQRIAIARALIKDSPILVLDEATSALDSESEQLIQEALKTLMKGRTTIVIAHRLSTIQSMDKIVVMEQGRILEAGSHKELIKNKGKYASLWAHQTGGFLKE